MPISLADVDFVASNHFSPQASLFWGVLVLLFGGVTAVVMLVIHGRDLVQRGADEARAAATPSDLAAGPNKIVRGKVEPIDVEPVAVRVEVKQTVKNHTSKNSRWHTWEESGRRTLARPFYLTREGAETVLVEPGDDVFVIDDMQTTYRNCGSEGRLRYCDVEAGEEFSAYGTLVRGPHPRAVGAYRDGAAGYILKPPANGRMYLASGTIKDRYKERISYVRKWAIALGLVLAAFHGFFTTPFLAATFFGVSDPAQVVSHRTWVTHNKNSTTNHYAVSVVTEGGTAFEREVTYSTYATLSRIEHTNARVPTVHFRDWEAASYLGDRASMSGVALLIALGAGIIALVVYMTSYASKCAWYDRKKLSEEGGTGHYTGPPLDSQ